MRCLPFSTYLLLVPAGVLAGITGSVAGLASLVSYPALLALGLPPVVANVSNTVALVFGGIGSVSASRVELAGRARSIAPLAVAMLSGGGNGGLTLMLAPAASFTYSVPWLIAGASAAVLLPRRAGTRSPHRSDRVLLYGGTTLIGVYGGYFGAAAGVLLLALLLAMTEDTLPQIGAARNLLLGLANAVASVVFILFGTVNWFAAIPLAVGFLIGGRLGPVITRKTPAGPLRFAIALAGLGLALDLGWRAYH
ncbi:MAG: sulfite exporter TauE/SafE family protein [Polyangiaceae bacterium]